MLPLPIWLDCLFQVSIVYTYTPVNSALKHPINTPHLKHTLSIHTVGFLCLFVAGGYACFYYGTEGVPFAVADGLLSAETLVTFVLSAFVFDEYKGTELFSPVFTFLLLGCIFYIYAVVVLSVLSF